MVEFLMLFLAVMAADAVLVLLITLFAIRVGWLAGVRFRDGPFLIADSGNTVSVTPRITQANKD